MLSLSSRPRLAWPGGGIVGLVVLVCLCTAPVAAGEGLVWASPQAVTSAPITSVACPSTSFCAVVDTAGEVATSTDPTASPATWQTTSLDSHSLEGIACPSSGLCVAVDSNGNVLTSTDPTGGAGAWTTTPIAGTDNTLTAVSCPATSFCLAAAVLGQVYLATNPTGGASAWSSATIGDALLSLTCLPTFLCIGGDSRGNMLTSSNPGAASAWTSVHVDGNLAIRSVSCPSAGLCAAADGGEHVLVSTDPTGGAGAWTVTPIDANNDLEAVSCPTMSLCVAVDGFGNAFTSTNPTGGAIAWGAESSTGDFYEHDLDHIACPSELFCLAADHAGNVMVGNNVSPIPDSSPTITGELVEGQTLGVQPAAWSNAPTTFTYEWLRCDTAGEHCFGGFDASEATYTLSAADVGHTLRVSERASNNEGTSGWVVSAPTGVIQAAPSSEPPSEPAPPAAGSTPSTSSPPPPPMIKAATVTPSRAQLEALLAGELVPVGQAAKSTSLHKHNGIRLTVKALTAGSLTMQWYAPVTTGQAATPHKTKSVLLAAGSRHFAGPGKGILNLKLTPQGRKLFVHAKPVKVTIRGTFTPLGDVGVQVTREFVVRG